ncbi:MAG: RHS repeat-associated core domain-containing protein [Bacteroidales bacterium]|nr:RHS repeat-associated core domain-containing protein [Bacteroidales bacterium]
MIYEDNTLKRILVDGGYIEDGRYHFYVQDHLGNNRMVVDQEGAVAQITHYYPFGMSFAESTNASKQPYKYNGKELDMENSLNTYDYEARLLGVAVPRFTTMDPLAEKYYSISPYAYVLNNPLKYIDPDGRKVYFAPGQSQEFKTQFGAAVLHLNKHGVGEMLAQLHSSEKVYYVAEGNFKSGFMPKNQTIEWDPYMGVLTDEGHVMSPTAALNHEVDHALQYDTNKGQLDLAKIEGDPYGTAEERRVIEGSEQTTAKALKEIKEGEVTRKNHGGIKYRTIGPTSTKGVYELEEIVVTPNENENEKNNILENTWDIMYPWNTDFMRK